MRILALGLFLLQGGSDDSSPQLRLAAVLFVNTVEHRQAIQPQREPVHFFVGQVDAVAAFFEQGEQTGRLWSSAVKKEFLSI